MVGYSRGDLNTWSELCARVAVAGGARSHDVAQISFEYGLTTGAFGMHAGLERVGVDRDPGVDGQHPAPAADHAGLQDHRAGGHAVLRHAHHRGGARAGLRLQRAATCGWACSGSEPWTNQLRDELERRTGMSASDIYGLSEVIGPGVSYECWNKDGLHINEDHFLVEVVDPATGEPVPDGKEGELVFTSLTKEALPVIRYRSGDLASISYRPCACGRVFARHSKVYARTDDMLIIRGVNVYPSSIEAVLLDIEKVEPHYQISRCTAKARSTRSRSRSRCSRPSWPTRCASCRASSSTWRSACARNWASGPGCGWWSRRPSRRTSGAAVIDDRDRAGRAI